MRPCAPSLTGHPAHQLAVGDLKRIELLDRRVSLRHQLGPDGLSEVAIRLLGRLEVNKACRDVDIANAGLIGRLRGAVLSGRTAGDERGTCRTEAERAEKSPARPSIP